jgi:hypothetical protein
MKSQKKNSFTEVIDMTGSAYKRSNLLPVVLALTAVLAAIALKHLAFGVIPDDLISLVGQQII